MILDSKAINNLVRSTMEMRDLVHAKKIAAARDYLGYCAMCIHGFPSSKAKELVAKLSDDEVILSIGSDMRAVLGLERPSPDQRSETA